MGQFFQVHPDNPQVRLIRQAVDIVRDGVPMQVVIEGGPIGE